MIHGSKCHTKERHAIVFRVVDLTDDIRIVVLMDSHCSGRSSCCPRPWKPSPAVEGTHYPVRGREGWAPSPMRQFRMRDCLQQQLRDHEYPLHAPGPS